MKQTVRAVFLLGFCMSLVLLNAQAAKVPVVKVMAFSGNGLTPSEITTLERLVASYIVELKSVRVIDNAGKELVLTETENALAMGSSVAIGTTLVPDYIVSGSLGKVGDLFIFTLDNTKVATSEKISVSDTATSINDIVLRAKALTRSLFGRGTDTPPITVNPSLPSPQSASSSAAGTVQAGPQFKTAVTITDLVGTWQGDKGIESVRIFADRSGVAVLSAGGTMKIRIEIDGSTVILVQNQGNDPRMYRSASINYSTALRIAEKARPMRWILQMTPEGNYLIGIKETVAVSGTGDAMKIDNSFTRAAQWKRIAR